MRILLFSAAYGISGSSIRALLIAKGLHRLGNDVAVSGYTIPDSLQTEMQSYRFKEDTPGYDCLLSSARHFDPEWIFGITDDEAGWIIRVKNEVGCRASIDLHGIGIFEILDLGYGYGNRIKRINKSISNLSWLNKSDLIVTCTPNLFRLARMIWGKSKVTDVTGMLDTQPYLSESDHKKKSNQDLIRVLYIGNYYKWQGVDLFLNAAEKVYQYSQKFSFGILGSVGKEQVKEVLKHPLIQCGKIQILGPVIHENVPHYTKMADILVIPRPFMLSSYFGFPSKLCEYMASGNLVIATNLSPHRWALQNPASGILCPPTAEGLAQAVLEYDADKAVLLGNTARETAFTRFDYLKQCQRIHDAFASKL